MTPTEPQADRLRDALHQRAETMPGAGLGAPISLEAVQGRAGRIRRRRRVAAGIGVAAVLVVVAPLGVVASGGLGTEERRPEPAAPVVPSDEPVGDLDFTGRGLAAGDETTVPWIDVRRGVVVAGDLVVDGVAGPRDALRWDGGLLVTGDAGDARLHVLDEAGRPLAEPVDLVAAVDGVVGAPSRDEVAWVEEDGAGGQRAVVAPDGDVLGGERLTVALPDLGGFSPVGIGPDGLVLEARSPDGRASVVLAGRDGSLSTVDGLGGAVGVDPATGAIAGSTAGDRPCAVVVSPDGEPLRAADCSLALRAMSPDGRWLLATGSDADGLGDRSMSVLDTATGEVQVTWRSRTGPPADLTHRAWEDDDTVLAAVHQGEEATIVRFRLDGSVERAGEVVPWEPFGDLAVVLPH